MKIAIVGAHGVGKTTLSEKLAKYLNLPTIHDVAIEALDKGFEINENTPPETQFWLFARQLEEERLTKAFVADKCLMDYTVYADIIFDDDRLKSLLAEMIEKNAKYDYVFYLPIEFPIEDNGIRSTDVEFQKRVDERYRDLLNSWNIKHTTLSGSVEDRLKKALESL